MNAAQTDKIRRRLEAELDSVATEIEEHSGRGNKAPDEVEGWVVTSDGNLIEKIELALRRIEDGTYGICLGCKAQIPLDRLEAKPSVSLCAPCQVEKEQNQ